MANFRKYLDTLSEETVAGDIASVDNKISATVKRSKGKSKKCKKHKREKCSECNIDFKESKWQ